LGRAHTLSGSDLGEVRSEGEEQVSNWTEQYEFSQMIRHTVADLSREFDGTFSAETVDRFVRESFESIKGSKVQSFVPLFTARFARDRLRALAQAQGLIEKEVPEVLFVCVQNAGRSQMAAGLLHRAAQGTVHVRSAGSTPANEIHQNVRRSMTEIGVDLEQEFPKPLSDEVVRAADVVITMGCGDACPVYPGKRYLDWDVPDPEGKGVEEVRSIRDEIDRRVRRLLDELVPTATT
jgi:arsenate reductase